MELLREDRLDEWAPSNHRADVERPFADTSSVRDGGVELGNILRSFKTVVAAELNDGQLRQLLRAEFLIDVQGLNKVRGEPFLVRDITKCIEVHLSINNTSHRGAA